MTVRVLAALFACLAGLPAQELLPREDPPAAIASLADRLARFRAAQVGRTLELRYPEHERAWSLVHACVRGDTGRIKAMKPSFGRAFRGADRDPAQAYALAIQAYHLHHAGEFPQHLEDELAELFTQSWEIVGFPGLDPQSPFEHGLFHLPAAACVAALLPEAKVPATRAFALDSLEHLAGHPPHSLAALNASLHAALLTGRIGRLKNPAWKRRLDQLRDTLPPNGATAAPGPPSAAGIFEDRGAALRLAKILFKEPSYLHAADKFQAAARRDEDRPGRFLSPLQWAYLDAAALKRMTPTAPPVRSFASDGQLILRTGHHPRAAFAAVHLQSGSIDLRAGGSRLGSERGNPGFTAAAPRHAAADPAGITIEDRNGDVGATLVFPDVPQRGSTLTRRLVLTREGILAIADRIDGEVDGSSFGPAWTLHEGATARGDHWCAFDAADHFLPPGYDGEARTGLVWFAAEEGGKVEIADGIARHLAAPGRREFLTLVVPLAKGLDPRAVAAAIAAEGGATVSIGRVTIAFDTDAWSITGNGRLR